MPKKEDKTKLIKRMNLAIEKAYNYERKKTEPIFHPSVISSPCLRKIFYSYLQVPWDKPMDAKNARKMNSGDANHKMVKGWLRKVPDITIIDYLDPKTGKIPVNYFTKEEDPEFKIVNMDIPIKGKIDMVVIIDGKLYVVEIKSMKDERFQELDEEKPDHAQQAMIYAYVLELGLNDGTYAHIPQLQGFKEVAGVLYIYISKDTSEMKEYETEKLPKAFSRVLTKAEKVKEHVAEKTLPKKTEDWCNFCSYKKKCDKNYNPL